MITDAQRKAVASMQDLERQVRALHDRQDEIMTAVLPSMDQLSDADLLWWVNHLPTGFYRSEIRTEQKRRLGTIQGSA